MSSCSILVVLILQTHKPGGHKIINFPESIVFIWKNIHVQARNSAFRDWNSVFSQIIGAACIVAVIYRLAAVNTTCTLCASDVMITWSAMRWLPTATGRNSSCGKCLSSPGLPCRGHRVVLKYLQAIRGTWI